MPQTLDVEELVKRVESTLSSTLLCENRVCIQLKLQAETPDLAEK